MWQAYYHIGDDGTCLDRFRLQPESPNSEDDEIRTRDRLRDREEC